jgi:cell filamentation protein, protein adenylyltransferase
MAEEKRDYEKTHPYINFSLKLHDPNASLWLLLGEAKSKSMHIARTLLHPQRSHELMQVFLAKGVLATTAIEGNTLSEEDARRVIENRSELPRSKQYLGQEIQNVLDAYNVVLDAVLKMPDAELTPAHFQRWNSLILKDLSVEEGVRPGQFRHHSVVVGNYRAPPARDVEHLLERLCDWLGGDFFELPDERPEFRAALAIVKAVIAHLYFVWIHPFGDGNGRTARLLELQILLAAGFPTPATQLLSNHYNQTRSEYYRQLQAASRTGDPVPFLVYGLRGFVDGLAEQLDLIFAWQREDRWEQYVYQQFGELRSEAERRRLRLVLEVSKVSRSTGKPIPKADMRWLTPKLAQAYDGKTDKTLSRDLNAIRKLALLNRGRQGYVPNEAVLLGFFPTSVEGVLADERMSLVEKEPSSVAASPGDSAPHRRGGK